MPIFVVRGHVVFAQDAPVADKTWEQMTPAERAAERRRVKARWSDIVDLMLARMRETQSGKVIPDERYERP